MRTGITLSEFILSTVSKAINQIGLLDLVGAAGNNNVHGDIQQKFDIYANKIFRKALSDNSSVAGIGSEEETSFINFNNKNSDKYKSQYVVLIDPVDGSSNTDTTVPIGTIFSS